MKQENKEEPKLFRDKDGVLWRLDDDMTWVEVAEDKEESNG